MKLKVGSILARAKHLFRSDRVYEKAGALIRRRSVRASQRCARLGRDTDMQRQKSLKEFLAFFCVVSVNELGLKMRTRSHEELRAVYERLCLAVCEGRESDRLVAEHQAGINGLIRYKRSGFDHWFFGYWNADWEGMRISQADLRTLEEQQIGGPTGEFREDAFFILLVRVARHASVRESIPSAAVLRAYGAVIREEVDQFGRELKRICS